MLERALKWEVCAHLRSKSISFVIYAKFVFDDFNFKLTHSLSFHSLMFTALDRFMVSRSNMQSLTTTENQPYLIMSAYYPNIMSFNQFHLIFIRCLFMYVAKWIYVMYLHFCLILIEKYGYRFLENHILLWRSGKMREYLCSFLFFFIIQRYLSLHRNRSRLVTYLQTTFLTHSCSRIINWWI